MQQTTRLQKWANDITQLRTTKLHSWNRDGAITRNATIHLDTIIAFNKILFYTGLFFSFLDWTSIFPWIFMGISMSSHWTTVSHHVIHGGYTHDTKYNRFTYAVKMRRFMDWMDYMLPEAWCCEHNTYHHYMLNEYNDPDNVQHNLAILRTMRAPYIVKYAIILFFAITWRLLYYSSNSYKYYKANRIKHTLTAADCKQTTLIGIITNEWPSWIDKVEYFNLVLLPVLLYRVACFIPIYAMYQYFPDTFTYAHLMNVITNYVLADIVCNIHTFVIIVPNHSGGDMYLYKTSVKGKSDEWLLRQCISSANYTSGSNCVDYLQGWLNYQIEHHLFPDMSLYEYQLIRKDVEAVCKKYGVPYVSENVFVRLWKTVKIMTGRESIPYYEGSELERYMNEPIS